MEKAEIVTPPFFTQGFPKYILRSTFSYSDKIMKVYMYSIMPLDNIVNSTAVYC